MDGGGIPPPDDGQPEGEQHPHDDAADWTYHRPRGEHAGMGMPYYGKDGSLRWDRGVRNMPADDWSLPPEYRRCLWKGVHYDIVRYAIAAMLRQNPNAKPGRGRAGGPPLPRPRRPPRTGRRTAGRMPFWPASGGSMRMSRMRRGLRTGARPETDSRPGRAARPPPRVRVFAGAAPLRTAPPVPHAPALNGMRTGRVPARWASMTLVRIGDVKGWIPDELSPARKTERLMPALSNGGHATLWRPTDPPPRGRPAPHHGGSRDRPRSARTDRARRIQAAGNAPPPTPAAKAYP